MQLFPLNAVLENYNKHVIDQLPAAHCLTGCDTVAKVGTKSSMLKVLIEHDQLLTHFGKDLLDEDMINDASESCGKQKIKQCSTFDDLRAKMYFHSRSKRIIELPCTSRAI